MDLHQGLVDHPRKVDRRLLSSAPIRRITGPDGSPAWIVTRHEDVRANLTNPMLSLDKRRALEGGFRGLALPPSLDANLLHMGPPDHARIRRLVGSALTARHVTQLRIPIRQTTDQLLSALGDQGRTNLITAYAAPLPIAVIANLLSVPAQHRRNIRSWIGALIAPGPARPESAHDAVTAMLGYFTRLLDHKRGEPADDMLSDLIAMHEEDDRLTAEELLSFVFLILFEYENTVQLIGNAVLTLLQDPQQLAIVRAHPELIPGAVAELMRPESPAPLLLRRFPTQDITIGGLTVPAGEAVLLSLSAANHEAWLAEPDSFKLSRDTSAHLALGRGIHYGLGATLARVETEIALTALFERFPSITLATQLPHWRSPMQASEAIELPVVYSRGPMSFFSVAAPG